MKESLRRLAGGWRRFGRWRRRRPFWAGVLVVGSALVIMFPPYASFRVGDAVLAIRTIGGLSALFIGALLLVCALMLWLRRSYRVPVGLAVLVLSLVALVVSNLGGLLVGSTLGLVGASLALSWSDRSGPSKPAQGSRSIPSLPGLALLTVGALCGVDRVPPLAGAAPPAGAIAPAGRTWVLAAAHADIDGLAYHGVRTTQLGGRTVSVLHFTATGVALARATLRADLGNGNTLEVTAGAATATAPPNRPVDLLVRRITGDLELLVLKIPVDFSPANPPPLVLPHISASDVVLVATDLARGVLSVNRAKFRSAVALPVVRQPRPGGGYG